MRLRVPKKEKKKKTRVKELRCAYSGKKDSINAIVDIVSFTIRNIQIPKDRSKRYDDIYICAQNPTESKLNTASNHIQQYYQHSTASDAKASSAFNVVLSPLMHTVLHRPLVVQLNVDSYLDVLHNID
jgi:translation initiation factor 2 beta subunit (eIF-2beta)/eIF-5